MKNEHDAFRELELYAAQEKAASTDDDLDPARGIVWTVIAAFWLGFVAYWIIKAVMG